MNLTNSNQFDLILLDICKHSNVAIQISRLAKIIRIYPEKDIFRSDQVWAPIALRLGISADVNIYHAVAEIWSNPIGIIDAGSFLIFTTRSNRIYMVENLQFHACRIDDRILDLRTSPARELVDFAFSKNLIAFLVKEPYGIIINDMGLLMPNQISRQVFLGGIMWTELVMFRNIKMKKILVYWSNLMVLLENGFLLTLFANRAEITDSWKMNTMLLKLPENLGLHNRVLDIEDTDYVYNLITNRPIYKEEDTNEVYPPIYKLIISDGEIYANICPSQNPTVPNPVLNVMDTIDNN